MEASMCRWAANIPGTFEPALFNADKTAFAVQRRACSSSFEFVIDDDAAAPLGAPADAISHRPPHAAHYLFNSMPSAYAWFHH
jgi:hypothetical protein